MIPPAIKAMWKHTEHRAVNQLLSPWKSTHQSSYSPTTINKNVVYIHYFQDQWLLTNVQATMGQLTSHCQFNIKALTKVKSNTWRVSTSTRCILLKISFYLNAKGFIKWQVILHESGYITKQLTVISSSWELTDYKGGDWFVPQWGNTHLACDFLCIPRSFK